MGKLNDITENLYLFKIVNSNNYGKAMCEISWSWNPPPLTDYDLWYVVSGRGNMELYDVNYPLQKGTCFLFCPGQTPHAYQDPHNRLVVIYIHFTTKFELITPKHNYIQFLNCLIIDTLYFESLLDRIIYNLENETTHIDAEFDFMMKLLLIQLNRSNNHRIHDSGHISEKSKRLITTVIETIRVKSGDNMTCRKVSNHLGVSSQYLNRIFNQYTGISLRDFIMRERMKRAIHLLSETTLNVSEVAETLGYSSVFLFSKQFKKFMGVSPSHYSHKKINAKPHN